MKEQRALLSKTPASQRQQGPVSLCSGQTRPGSQAGKHIQLEDNVAVRPGLYKLDINKFRLESSRFLIRL